MILALVYFVMIRFQKSWIRQMGRCEQDDNGYGAIAQGCSDLL